MRVSPALCSLGPRLPLPSQVGAYIGGGGLQHVRHLITWMEGQQGNYLFPYWATAYLGIYHLAIYLAVQRPCCYGRAAQFYSDYLAILPCCSSPQGSCHCACSLSSFPICHAPWGRLQDNIHIRQVGQHSQIRHMLTYMVYSD